MTNEIQELIVNGSRKITPAQIAQFEDHLPLVLAKINEADPPKQPNLEEQAQFLVRFVEDCLDDKYQPDDLAALAEALFALMYLDKQIDIIPDAVPGIGYADDSAVIRTVLLSHEAEFTKYGVSCGSAYAALPLEA